MTSHPAASSQQAKTRRRFLGELGAIVAVATGAQATATQSISSPNERAGDVFGIRKRTAEAEFDARPPQVRTNGDEARYSNFIGSYSKGLPLDAMGEVDSSTDQTGNFVFEVMPQRVGPSAGEQFPYWNTAGANDTMYSLWNPGTTSQDLVLSLNTSDGRHAYNLPLHLAPGASTMVDLVMLRMAGTPDPQGNLLPPEADAGSAMLHPANMPMPGPNGRIKMPKGGPPQMNVVVSMGIFNVQTATCCTDCGSCCFFSCPNVFVDEIAIGDSVAPVMTVDDCTGLGWDCSADASWDWDSSFYQNNNDGTFTGLSVGTSNISGSVDMNAPDPRDPYCLQGCAVEALSALGGGTIAPRIDSISPDAILAGNSASVTIHGAGFGASPTVNLPSGFSLSGQSSSDTAITFTLSITTGATLGNNNISVTANFVPSLNANFIADYPSEMVVQSDNTVKCSGCSITAERDIFYQVKTFAGNSAANIGIGESIGTANWTCTDPSGIDSTACGHGSTDASGIFGDGWTLAFDDVAPAGCGYDTTDHWQWCAMTPPRTFGTLTGYIHQLVINVNGVVSPNRIPVGTVITP